MTNRARKVFIDPNMLMFAAEFQQADIFSWLDQLYAEIYVHQEVLNELILPKVRGQVERYIERDKWQLVIPERDLKPAECEVYRVWLTDVKQAFTKMRLSTLAAGGWMKSTTDLGEMATIPACMLVGAQIICSNDFDIRTVVEKENYTIATAQADLPIIQDSAADFCVYCYQEQIASRKNVRKFFRFIIADDVFMRDKKLAELDHRLGD